MGFAATAVLLLNQMTDPFIQLLVQYCNTHMPDRQAEFDECLRRNLANSSILAVHNLVETTVAVPIEFTTHPKYRQQLVPRWLTYADAFEYANANLPGQIVCLCNLDIFLDERSDWTQAAGLLARGVVLCLSRTEYSADGDTFEDPGFAALAFANTQDAWLFQPPVRVANADFEIGTPGCDNAIAHRFKQAGYFPLNAASRFRILHYDRCRGETGTSRPLLRSSETVGYPGQYPEERGQYLLPDFDKVRSVDQILAACGVDDLQRYEVICDTLSRFIKTRNR